MHAHLAFFLETVRHKLVSTFNLYNIRVQRGTRIKQKCFVLVPRLLHNSLVLLNVKISVSNKLLIVNLVHYLTSFAY